MIPILKNIQSNLIQKYSRQSTIRSHRRDDATLSLFVMKKAAPQTKNT